MRKLRVLPARPHNESNNFVLANSVKTVLTVLRQVSLPQLIWPKSESFYFLSFLLKAVWNTPTCQAYTRHQKSQILLLYQLTILRPTHNFTHCMRWKMNNIAPKHFEFLLFYLTRKEKFEKRVFFWRSLFRVFEYVTRQFSCVWPNFSAQLSDVYC